MKATNQQKRIRRHQRIRSKIKGTAARPRLALFRGQRTLIAQLIDDDKGITLVYLTDKSKDKVRAKPLERAAILGKQISEAAQARGINTVVFDRGGWRFHGRVKVFAEAVRESGIKF